MWAHLPFGQRAALVGIGCLTLALLSAIGARSLRPVAPIVITEGSEVAVPATREAAGPGQPSEVVVHVAGAVKSPGVIHLPVGSRGIDAIAKCGGATKDADLDGLNLAEKLVDGTQLRVPRRGEVIPSVAQETQGSSHGSRGRKAPPKSAVSINSASAEQLQAIPGIGPATAGNIVEYRHEHGTFESVDALTAVTGIGEKKLAKMRRYLKL